MVYDNSAFKKLFKTKKNKSSRNKSLITLNLSNKILKTSK
jgi:hypothetical protein